MSDLIDNVAANRKPYVLAIILVFSCALFYSFENYNYERYLSLLFGKYTGLFSVISSTLLLMFAFKNKALNFGILFFIVASLVLDRSYLEAFRGSVVFVAIYYYSSRYFNPDLDQEILRPGMRTFPIGKKLSRSIPGLGLMLWPINRAWYYLWHPYGFLMTHRGVSHWPLMGTLTRVLYVFGVVNLISILLSQYTVYNLALPNLGLDEDLIMILSPLILSDINHFIVDMYDSKRKGNGFIQGVRKGLIGRIIGFKF